MAKLFTDEVRSEIASILEQVIQEHAARAGIQLPSEPLLTVPQLAARLQLDEKWIYEQTRAGKLPVIKCGKYLRFDLREVMEHLKREHQKNSST
jgi:excisionase family DNA binding protein